MAIVDVSYFDRLLEPVAQCFTPELAQRLVSLRPNPAIQSRIAELAAKANEGQLTDEERADYEDYVDAVDVIAVLQARARSTLERASSSPA
jgi:hypothetical protein